MKRASAIVTSVFALAGCGSTDASSYSVEVRFATPELRTRAVAVEVHAVERCGPFAAMAGDPEGVLTSASIGQGPSTMALGQVPAGRVGVYAIARDATCRVIAVGCEEYTVALKTTGTVSVSLAALMGPECPNTSLCDQGFCGLQDGTGVCAPDTSDCDRNAANRCEARVATDVMNCGECGHRCSATNGTATCVAGACVTQCNAGRSDCDMDPDNGCEATLATDLANCGTCGIECPELENATPTCTAGACGFFCNGTSADCDMMAVNGCEVETRASLNNCGSCGHVCTLPNATPQCLDGQCVVEGCMAGFANCDMNSANGCEHTGPCT